MGKTAKILIATIVGLALLGGVTFALTRDKSSDAMSATESHDAMTKDEATDTSANSEDAMAKSGRYVTLADYNANPDKYADSKKVYFFHASWCPTCQGIDREITNDPSRIPAGVTIIKTDFDTQTALRQKYGVTYQYTFVQVDDKGNKVAKWTASNLEAVLAGVQG
ncbi:thioredoxin family protein [Candidatus Saccharibacteria bacterium]|nr:thioredoxin family protein [Candidatus Saccharibacteria bacterium]